jgi:outer membrane biosynthesis protein TonB
MKAGVTFSVIAHATFLALALVGLGAAKPLEPEVVESIAVELVPISEVTNIRMGSLDSTVVETETPAVVETETPAELAKPTGNTEEDQVTPTETDRETPAEAAAAPVPMMRPAALNRKPAPENPEETKVAEVTPAPKTPTKTETPKPAPTKPADEAAKEADQVAALINSETSRGATTGQGGTPTLGKNTGRASTLTQSQLDGLIAQIRGCFNIQPAWAEAGITAQLMFNIDAGGNVNGTPQIVSATGTQLERALASAAQRAVMRCGPYQMAVNQEVKATFDPRELL